MASPAQLAARAKFVAMIKSKHSSPTSPKTPSIKTPSIKMDKTESKFPDPSVQTSHNPTATNPMIMKLEKQEAALEDKSPNKKTTAEFKLEAKISKMTGQPYVGKR